MQKITAFQVAEHINIKALKQAYTGKISYMDSTELLYVTEDDRYIYTLSYGVVVFYGYDEIKMSEFLEFIVPFSKNILEEKLQDDLMIVADASDLYIGYNEIRLPRLDSHVFRIAMLNLAQSVALDYYTIQTEQLLEDTKVHTLQLERNGRLAISGTNLRRFIGKTLNLKNRIAENLYILDSPAETWDDEYLNKVDQGLKRTFDLSIRYRNNAEDLQIIKENLDLFKDLMMHRTSNILEWIIIALILVEVINLFIEKVF